MGTVVELHDVWRKSVSAVSTWPIAQAEQQLATQGLGLPLGDAARRVADRACRAPMRPSFALQDVGSERVAIRAHDVAFRDLVEHALARRQQWLRHLEQLGRGITMIEVHLVRLERPSAVHARNAAQRPEELERRTPPREDAVDLALSISLVVADVVRALGTCARHSPNMRHVGEPCQ